MSEHKYCEKSQYDIEEEEQKAFQGCNKCKYEKTDRYSYPCSFCIHNAEEHFQPQTNADRIRNMSDEELAELLEDVRRFGFNNLCCDDDLCDSDACDCCVHEWLQAEVKEGEADA